MIPIFDKDGAVAAWLFEGTIYTLNGNPAAFLQEESVLNYSGAYCGIFRNSFFRDRSGDVVGFLKGASGGPRLPLPKPPPPAPMKGLPPMRPQATMSPVQGMVTFKWSAISWQDFLLAARP